MPQEVKVVQRVRVIILLRPRGLVTLQKAEVIIRVTIIQLLLHHVQDIPLRVVLQKEVHPGRVAQTVLLRRVQEEHPAHHIHPYPAARQALRALPEEGLQAAVRHLLEEVLVRAPVQVQVVQVQEVHDNLLRKKK